MFDFGYFCNKIALIEVYLQSFAYSPHFLVKNSCHTLTCNIVQTQEYCRSYSFLYNLRTGLCQISPLIMMVVVASQITFQKCVSTLSVFHSPYRQSYPVIYVVFPLLSFVFPLLSSVQLSWPYQRLIMITCSCNVHPRTPHFYVVKLGFTGVYIIFLFLL